MSLDENGSLYVEPPKWTLKENGVIGVGRTISMQEIHQGSQFLVDSYAKSYPNHPKIPASFAGHSLTELYTGNDIEAIYIDFSSTYDYVNFRVDNVSAQDQKYFLNFGYANSEFWQIDDSVIRISGSALDKNNDQDDSISIPLEMQPRSVEPNPCGPGTELVNGICQVIKIEKMKTAGDDAPFFGIFEYLDNLISWILGK